MVAPHEPVTALQESLNGVDGMRMEHIWLVVAAECVNCLWRSTSGDPLYIVELVGHLLQDQLMDLCRFYDEKLLSDQRQNRTELMGNLSAEQLALGLWNTDVAEEELSEDDQQPMENRSRLLSGLAPDQLQQLANLTVTFGVVIRKDLTHSSGRSAMPLQPEVLQALLWQGMRLRLDLVNQDSVSTMPECIIHPGPVSQLGQVQMLYRRTLMSASKHLRDLRFVGCVGRLITALRRPPALGLCILAAPSGTQAVHCAAAYLHAAVAPVYTEASASGTSGSKSLLLYQLLRAAAKANRTHTPVILVVTSMALHDAEQLRLLQQFLATSSLSGLISASDVLRAFADDLQELVDTFDALGHMAELQAALPHVPLPLPTHHSDSGQDDDSLWSGNPSMRTSSGITVTPKQDLPRHGTTETKPAHPEKNFIERLNDTLEQTAELMRICLLLQPSQHTLVRATCPLLFRRSILVHMTDANVPLDTVACLHMIMCDHQHIIRPWNSDAAKEEVEVPQAASTAAQLLLQTCEGTASGLTFMHATEYVTEPVLVMMKQTSKSSEVRSCVQQAFPLYSAVLAQACAKHVFAGRSLTPGAAAAMRNNLKQCSRTLLRFHDIGRKYLQELGMECGLEKQTKLLEMASAVFSRHRKLMRHQLGQLSHFLRLVEELNTTLSQLHKALGESSGRPATHDASLSAAQEQLSQVSARVEHLVAAQAERESAIQRAQDEISRIKDKTAEGIETIRSRYRTSVAAVLHLAERDLVELRTYSSPPPAVMQVLAAVCMILGLPTDWESALTLMNHSDVSLAERIRDFDVVAMRQVHLVRLRTLLQGAELQPDRVAAVSAAAHSLALWVRAVEEHGNTDELRRHARQATRMLLDDSSASQAQMVENAVELQELNSTLAELKAEVNAASHDSQASGLSARAQQEAVATLGAIKEALAPHMEAMQARTAALQQRLSCLLGDSLRAAALCVYGGMFPAEPRLRFQQEIQEALRERSVPHSPNLTTCQWMEFLEQQHALLPQRVMMDEGMQHAMYCMSMVRDLVLLVDREGEGLSMCKALHAQVRRGSWTELTLDSVAAMHQALSAVAKGCTVALLVKDMAIAEPLICELAQHLQLQAPAVAKQLLLHTRPLGPWPSGVQRSTVMIRFAVGTAAARMHVESAMIAATDRTAEESRRMELANVAACQRKCSETRAALLQLASTMQPGCWRDPALCSVALRRLKGLQRVEQEHAGARCRLQEILAATACLSPILDVTDALWAAVTTLGRRSLAFDVSFLDMLPWWQSVFRSALRTAQASALDRGSPRLSDTPAHGSHAGDNDAGDAALEDEHEDGTSNYSDDASSVQSGTSDGATTVSSISRGPSALQLRLTTATDSTHVAARFRANMLLPVHAFCAALLRSTAWWFDAPHCTLLCTVFHMHWGANSTCSPGGACCSPEAELLCDLFCRNSCLLQTVVPLADSRQACEETRLPAHTPGTAPDDEIRQSITSGAQMPVDCIDLDSLAWLECRCPALAGIAAAAKLKPATFFCKSQQGLLVDQLPAPFSDLRAVHRTLLAILLWPSEARATLAWFSESSADSSNGSSAHVACGAPDTFTQVDAAARVASALQCMEDYRPVLLHATAAAPPVGLLQRLISVDAWGLLVQGSTPASDTLEALCAGPPASIPRQACAQLRVVDVSAQTPLAACSSVIAEAASHGQWVLLSCAHLRPDICDACVAAAEALNQADRLPPRFRLFLACPTAELWRVPLRPRLVVVNYGDDRFSQTMALQLLRAVDSTAGSQLGLFAERAPTPQRSASAAAEADAASAAPAADMPMHHRCALQQWAPRVAQVLAAIVEHTCSAGSCGMLSPSRPPACTDRDFVHVLHVLKSMIARADGTATRAVRPVDLQAAILQVAITLGHGRGAAHAVALRLLSGELGSRHLQVGAPPRKAPQAARQAREPILTFPAFFHRAAAGMQKQLDAGVAACVHGVGCAPACQARGSRQILDVLYSSMPPRLVGSSGTCALAESAAGLLRELEGVQQEVDVLWRAARGRLLHAHAEPRQASTPADTPRSAGCLDSDSDAGGQLPTLLTTRTEGEGSGGGADCMLARPSSTPRQGDEPKHSSIDESSATGNESTPRALPAPDDDRQSSSPDQEAAQVRRGTFRRFTAFAASPAPVRGLQRRSHVGPANKPVPGIQADGPRRHTAALCAAGTGTDGQAALLPDNGAAVTATAAAVVASGSLRAPGAEPEQGGLAYRGPRRKRFTLRTTAPAASAPTQNMLVLSIPPGSEAELHATSSASVPGSGSGGLSGQSGDVGVTDSEASTDCGGARGPAEPLDTRAHASASCHRPPKLRESAVLRKRYELLGRCLLQELQNAGQALSAAITAVTRLEAGCRSRGCLPHDMERLISALRCGAVPAGWAASGTGPQLPSVCAVGQGPWLRARAVAGWLEEVRARVQRLRALIECDWNTGIWASEFHGLVWPHALVAASERVFAAANQYLLEQVETHVSVDCDDARLAGDEVHFMLTPWGCGLAAADARPAVPGSYAQTCSWRCMKDTRGSGAGSAVLHCTATLATRRRACGQEANLEGRRPVDWIQNDVVGAGTHMVEGISGSWTVQCLPLDDAGDCGGLVLEHRLAV
eukprot:jgi/Ulvmu1/3056/UM015_0096.1